MRKKRVAETVYSVVLVFLLSFSLVSSFSYAAKPRDSTRRIMRVVASSDDVVQPIIRHPDMMDEDFDGIQDSMENMVSQMVANKGAVLPVVVTLYNPVKSQDLDWFVMLGGRVTHVYRYVTYGFAGIIPASNISSFASLENDNLSIIEYDAPVRYHLDIGVPLIRARPIVWNTYGYTGSPNHSIAIIDTGIDDSHPDVGPFGNLNFSRKIVGWYDATPDMATTPEDYGEHGTHVAGIAASTGDANSLQASGFVTNTWAYKLSSLPPGQGWIHYGFDVMNPGLITLTCMWTSRNTVFLQLRDATGNIVLNQTSGKQKPLVLTYYATASGRYRPVVGITGGGLGSGYFSLRETYPYLGRDDGYNLFTGVAPTSKLVGVKVFDNTGSGTTSTVYGGMDWVIANKHTYTITVASMSLSLENGAVDTTFDQKADTMVENGIVTVVSAGNDYPDYTIGSPGTAKYVITVAATNDQNGITFYSSNGDPNKNEYGLVKPDVAAPGGSTGVGNLIISADSNDVDYEYSGQSDLTANDCQQMMGTSMSTPHVSGLAALLIQAFGSWSWTKAEALKVKMLIAMTAVETHSGEGANIPPLNRGGKDSVEGYGRISADAALEAATMKYIAGQWASDVFGPNPSDKKVWARRVWLPTETTYEFHLNVPLNADYDLYLYDGSPDSYGQPILLKNGTNTAVGAEETISYAPNSSSWYYIVVKWVSGGGEFTLESTYAPAYGISVVEVVTSASKVFVGWLVNITATVKNVGNAAETFIVTACCNSTPIGDQTVSNLSPNTSENIIFIWNTSTATPHAYYTVEVEAEVLPGETYTMDNVYMDGAVVVRMQGDVNDDGKVDIFDKARTHYAWGSQAVDDPATPWDDTEYWDAETDENNDGAINIIDIVILNKNYGRMYP